jgi:hypothetical protein
VLGSAGMAAFMTTRIAAEMPAMPGGGAAAPGAEGASLELPEFLREPFSAAMSQSMLLPAFVALFGIVATLFLVGSSGSAGGRELEPDDDYDDYVEYIVRREPDPGFDDADCDTGPVVARMRAPRRLEPEDESISLAHNGFRGSDGSRGSHGADDRPVADHPAAFGQHSS